MRTLWRTSLHEAVRWDTHTWGPTAAASEKLAPGAIAHLAADLMGALCGARPLLEGLLGAVLPLGGLQHSLVGDCHGSIHLDICLNSCVGVCTASVPHAASNDARHVH